MFAILRLFVWCEIEHLWLMKLLELDLLAYSIYFNVSKVLERMLRPFYFLRIRNIDASSADPYAQVQKN